MLVPAIGALIGYSAANRKGWNPVAGLIGGALLGILAPLMFCVSSVAGKSDSRKCPHCAEWVKLDAKVCKHCRKDLPPLPGTVKTARNGITVNVPGASRR